MKIGEDYDKVEFEFLGLDLLEPNAFIGDTLIFIVALFLAYKIKKLNDTFPFFRNWRWFYIVFGTGFFIGGLGHLMFNYWGIAGKISPWYIGIIASFLIERAMISIHPDIALKRLFNRLILIKLIISLIALTIVVISVDLINHQTMGLVVPTLNSFIGLMFALGYLGFRYSTIITPKFKFLWISILIMIPTILFQAFKINIHQWFDRNDFSHILLIIGIILYFISVKGYAEHLKARTSA